MLRDFLTWLGETPWSIGLHESLYAWPVTESLHVLTLALFAGTAAVLELRMLGVALKGVPVSALTNRLLPWTRVAFGLMVLTGIALFYATPLTYYHSMFFRIKMLLLAGAGVNIFIFHARTLHGIAAWDSADRPPRAARIAATVSLTAWAGVIVCGRLVAYNWFECALNPQSPVVRWIQSCPVTAP